MYSIGRIIGMFFMLVIIYPMRWIYGSKKCTYINLEKLKEIKGKSFIAAMNHVKPRSKFLKFISMPYDAFIVRKMLLQNGVYSTAITSYDSGKRSKKQKMNFFTKLKEPMLKGIIISMDLIPLNRNENDGTTFKDMRKRINKGNLAIGIFPEGTWFRGYRKVRKIHSGMGIYSKRFNLPILPLYINAYNLNQDIDIRVGDLIQDSQDIATLCIAVRDQFDKLKEQVILLPQIENNLDPSINLSPQIF